MVESQLFLDTHPGCTAALDYYKRVADEYDEVMTEYQNMYGPIVADAVTSDRWSWIDGPWPWQTESDTSDEASLRIAPKNRKAGDTGGEKA